MALAATALFAQSGPLKTPAEYGYKASVEPLLSGIHYGQDTPFNGMCPVLQNGALAGSSDKRAHTGCAATATAILLKYWASTKGYNIQPTGPATDTWTYTSTDNVNTANTQTITNNISEHTYDWSMILGDYSGTYSQDQANAIAQLMFDCGYALKMNYTQVTSDAGHEIIPKALFDYFGDGTYAFSKGMQTYYRNTTSQETWEKTIYSELAAGRPILIKGFVYGGGGGHEYLIDGYDEKGNLHINFGNADGGKYLPVYEHENYVSNFSIITGIELKNYATGKGSFTPSANIHRLNDVTYSSNQVSFQLRNDGLGQTESNNTGSKVKTALAVIRNGAVIGICGGSSKDVSLNASGDNEKYTFDLSLSSTSKPGISSTAINALSPRDIKVSVLSTEASAINNGDILVPVISSDNGRTWSIPDGNESRVNSIRIVPAEVQDGYYRIRTTNNQALTLPNGATTTTMATYNEEDDFQIFYLENNAKGFMVSNYMGEKFLYRSGTQMPVDAISTQNEDALHNIYRGFYSIVNNGEDLYTISLNGAYLSATQTNPTDATGYVNYASSTKATTWELIPCEPSQGPATYSVNFINSPYMYGASRQLFYNGTNDPVAENGGAWACTFQCNNYMLTPEQLKASNKTGYLYDFDISHKNGNHVIDIYYAQDANKDGHISIGDAAKLLKTSGTLTGATNSKENVDAAHAVAEFLLHLQF